MIQCTPPKTQLLKWVGNKQKFAVEIVKHFPHSYNFFYEPFLGSGAILATVAPSNGMGSDIFTPLMDIWNKLSLDPEGLVEWYKERRNLMEQIGKAEAYNVIRASYNANPNGADFLYLSRACYGGVIRFRKSDGFMSTPCGVHTPISIGSFEKRVKEWNSRLKNVRFEKLDYKMSFLWLKGMISFIVILHIHIVKVYCMVLKVFSWKNCLMKLIKLRLEE